MYVCTYGCLHACACACVDGDPVLHVLPGSSVVAEYPVLCPSKRTATPRRRENRGGQPDGPGLSSAYNSDKERHTDRDLCCLRSRAWVSLANVPPLLASHHTPPHPFSFSYHHTSQCSIANSSPSRCEELCRTGESRLFRPSLGGDAVRGWPPFGPQSTRTLARQCCPTNQALCEPPRRLNLRRVFAAKVIKHKGFNQQRLK